MHGWVKMVNPDRSFGFIRGDNGEEYFFHKSGFIGHWADLLNDMKIFDKGKCDPIKVNFSPTDSSKGLRAEAITRLDGGLPVEYKGEIK